MPVDAASGCPAVDPADMYFPSLYVAFHVYLVRMYIQNVKELHNPGSDLMLQA